MSFRTDDSITLCQRALQIVTELCLTGHVDREKCSDIFPLESNILGKGHAGKYTLFLFCKCSLQFPRRVRFSAQTLLSLPLKLCSCCLQLHLLSHRLSVPVAAAQLPLIKQAASAKDPFFPPAKIFAVQTFIPGVN